MAVYCPYCDGEGEVYRAKVSATGECVYICSECDSLWLQPRIMEDGVAFFDDFMLERGLKPLWSELEDVEKL